MSRYYGSRTTLEFGGRLTPAVKALVLASVIAFALQVFERIAGGSSFIANFGLTPALVTDRWFLWQLVTYMFLHDTGNFFHILFNMFGLWMFGSELERLWGTRKFVKYYFICGIGAALTTIVVGPHALTTTIGASGAIYGILLAYGVLFPDRIIYLYFLIPLRAKYFVMIIGAITFLSSVSATGGGIAHIAHLGGMLVGFLYLRGGRLLPDLKWRYERWQRNKLRKKFEVYYSQRHEDGEDRGRKWRN